MAYSFEWNGDALTAEVREKAARGITAMATIAADFAKDLAPVGNPEPPQYDDHPGTLRRSVTVGAPLESHATDFERAKAGEDLLDEKELSPMAVTSHGAGYTDIHVEVGSWIPYACVEEVRHPFIYPAVELMKPSAIPVMVEAFRLGNNFPMPSVNWVSSDAIATAYAAQVPYQNRAVHIAQEIRQHFDTVEGQRSHRGGQIIVGG